MLFPQPTALCTVLIVISLSSAQDVAPPQCGDSQICIRDPPSCSPDSACRFIAIFSPTSDPNLMRLKLQAQSETPRPYIAIRFSDTRIPVRSTVIYCSPKQRLLRFGFEQDGRVDFATQSSSDTMASITDSWARDGMIQCEFDRVISVPRGMMAAQSLSSPLHVQLITGSISTDGFPMSPAAAYMTDEAVDLARVGGGVPTVESTTTELPETTTQDEPKPSPAAISEKDLESLPEVNEKDLMDEGNAEGLKAEDASTTEALPSSTEEYPETSPESEVEQTSPESEVVPTSPEAEPTPTEAEMTAYSELILPNSTLDATTTPSSESTDADDVLSSLNDSSALVYDENGTVIAEVTGEYNFTGVYNLTNTTSDPYSPFQLLPDGDSKSGSLWRSADNSTTAGSGRVALCSFGATLLLCLTLF